MHRGSNVKNKLYCKILATGIIVLFMGVSVVTSADSVNVSDNLIEFKSFDDEVEIISFIDGGGRLFDSEWKMSFFVKHISISQGHIDIKAITSLNPYKEYKVTGAFKIDIPCFIGIDLSKAQDYREVYGIALGNIEWSMG